jgi:RNA polymerase sigma-70 factor (ECF subfamily)
MAFRAEIADFGAFYEATYQRAYRTTLAIVGEPGLAADAVQDAYLAAYRSRGRFRGEAPAEAWLIRIVANVAISALRRRRLRWVDPLPIELAGLRDEQSQVVDRLSILGALATLAPEQRAAIVLRYYLGYDYATIGRVLDAPAGTVGSWLSRGLARLGVALDGTTGAVNGRVGEVADAS